MNALFNHTPTAYTPEAAELDRPRTLEAQGIHWLRTHVVSLAREIEQTRNDLTGKGAQLAAAVEAMRLVLGK